jgi:acyl carrier protein
MTEKRSEIAEIVYAVVHDINGQLPAAQRLACHDDTVLLGDGGVLDSLGLVNFLASLEDALTARFGHGADLLDGEISDSDDSPLRTLGALTDHLSRRFA